MNSPIILLCGNSRSGKNVVGDVLAQYWNAKTIALADPIKRLLMALGLTEEELWGPTALRETDIKKLGSYESVRKSLESCGLDFSYKFWCNEWRLIRDNADYRRSALREAVTSALNVCYYTNRNETITPRYMLQVFGDYIRKIDSTFFADLGVFYAKQMLDGVGYNKSQGLTSLRDYAHAHAPDYVILTDGRLRNELISVKCINGACVLVYRDGADGSKATAPGVGILDHPSETELHYIPKNWYDSKLSNNNSKEYLPTRVNEMMKGLYNDGRKVPFAF